MWEGSERLNHKHVGGQQKVNSQNLHPWSQSKCSYFGQYFLINVYVIVWEGRCTCMHNLTFSLHICAAYVHISKSLQNGTARLVMQKSKREHATLLLRELH